MTQASRLRIVISTHTFLPVVGGAEVGIHELASRLADQYEVIVLAPSGAAADDPSLAGMPYRVIRVTPSSKGRRTLRGRILEFCGIAFLFWLIRLHRERAVAVVNPHFLRRNGLLMLGAKMLRIPVVLTLTGRPDVLNSLTTCRRWFAKSLIARCADGLVANSRYYLAGSKWAGQESVVPFGVDLVRFEPGRGRQTARQELGLSERDFVVLAVQRLEALKRVDLLLHAVAQLRTCDPPVRLVVAGTGTHAAQLRSLAEDLGLASLVRFTGRVDDDTLPRLYGAADAFASLSESETFGVTFAEAMASGLPVVAADTSCIADVLGPSPATIIPAGDIDRLGQVILNWNADRSLARRLGELGRGYAEQNLDWNSVAAQYRQIFERYAEQRPSIPAASA